jgi:IS30 family transposase
MKNKKRKAANGGCGHITTTDRQQIDLYLKEGKKFRRIAKLIGKGRNAISHEVRENSVKGKYDWKKADAKARNRRKTSKFQGMKIVRHDSLWKFVKAKLKLDWSPEQISGRLKYHEKKLPYVSAKGIYKFIYGKYGFGLEKYLRYRGNAPKRGDQAKSKAIDGRVFIESRPKGVMGRRIFGHWEADFIVSGKNGSGALLVFVERKSRYVLIFKLEDRKVATVNAVLGKLLGVTLCVASLTIDNDVCFRHHPQMSQILHAPIFFCHPYHSWEKGSVENMNKWIRQYVKKGCDISKLSDHRVQFVEDRLNGRPREVLRFKMPKEVFQKENEMKQEISDIIKVVGQQKNRVAAVS